eukprot:UN07988
MLYFFNIFPILFSPFVPPIIICRLSGHRHSAITPNPASIVFYVLQTAGRCSQPLF